MQKLYYGTEMNTGQPIFKNRLALEYPHGIIVGELGCGMYYTAQKEMEQVFLADSDNRIIMIDTNWCHIDLYRKYRKHGAYEINLTNQSGPHINPCCIVAEPNETAEDAVGRKCEFFTAMCEQEKIDEPDRKIIRRCVRELYRPYLQDPINFCKQGRWPTLQDFYEKLRQQPEPDAIYLQKESLRCRELIHSHLTHQESMRPDYKILFYDLSNIKGDIIYDPYQGSIDQTKNNTLCTAMLACLEDAYNEMVRNNRENRRTWLYITDPIYLQCCIGYVYQYIMKSEHQRGNVVTYLVNRWEEVPAGIMANKERCQYIQLFIPGLKEIVDQDMIKTYSISKQLVRRVKDDLNAYKKNRSQYSIRGLVSIGQKDKAGNPEFTPFVYPRP